MAQACSTPTHPQGTRASGHNNQALLAAPTQALAQGRGEAAGLREACSAPVPLHTHCLPRAAATPHRPGQAQPARRRNPPQSQAYVHLAGCAPRPGGPPALRSAAGCLRSAGATPIRCRLTGKAIGSRWTAGCPSSDLRFGAWGSACGRRQESRRGAPLSQRPLPAGRAAPCRLSHLAGNMSI